VTGGAGFIGSHIVDKLLERDDNNVVVIDNESSESNIEFYKNKKAKFYIYDINNLKKIEKVFKKHYFDYVFHLAAESRIQPCIEEPYDAIKTNAVGTTNILYLSNKYAIKRVVYSASSSVYGNKNTLPFKENMRTDCLNPYSISKLAGEDMCKIYTSLYELETISLRYFNVYGDREPIKGHYAPVIGLFLKQRDNDEQLTIVGDGKQRRDFTHIDDVVLANIKAMFTKNKIAIGKVINIGTGVNYSILEIAKAISADYKFIPKRQGEAQETLANIKMAERLLRWKPKKNLMNYIKD